MTNSFFFYAVRSMVQSVVLFFALALFLYLAFSIIQLEFNYSNWSTIAAEMYQFIATLMGIAFTIVSFIDDKK